MNPLPTAQSHRVISYRRVSSAEQSDRYGLEAQRQAIRAYAARHGLEIVADFAEDISGTAPLDDRPALTDALAAAYQHGAGGLLVARADRLARDEYVAFDAKRAFAAAGARVLYADSTNGEDDSALLLEGIQHVIAAHERRAIVARLRAGIRAKQQRFPQSRAQGGKVPYGYRRTATTLEIDPEQAAHVRRMFDLVREGKSLRKAAAILEAETGRRWAPQVIDGIIRRELYKQAEPGRIVDPRVWNQAQRALAKRRKR